MSASEREAFAWPVRVYYEDTDAGGVVYHAQYLKFLERARTEWLRSAGLEQDRLAEQEGILFAVTCVNVRYRAPARFNEALTVTVAPHRHGRVRIAFEQAIFRTLAPAEPLATATVEVACVDRTRFRPAPIPQSVIEKLNL